jgi:four helix bundle protein
MSSSFRDYVFGNALRLAVDVYRATSQFPRHEVYGLSQQLRRAAVSVAEQYCRRQGTSLESREFGNLLLHARGSLLEVQTQIMIAKELEYVSAHEGERLLKSVDAIGRSLNSLINSLQERAA